MQLNDLKLISDTDHQLIKLILYYNRDFLNVKYVAGFHYILMYSYKFNPP